MLLENQKAGEVLGRIAGRMTADATLREDLIQEALIHLWQQEARHPGQKPSWYLQGCRFHLKNYLRRGRSVDSGKHGHAVLAGWASDSRVAELLDESEASGSVIEAVSARDMVAQLSKWLICSERQILRCLGDGMSVREIARWLKLSHTAVIKQRRRIAAVAARLGINPLPKYRKSHTRRGAAESV